MRSPVVTSACFPWHATRTSYISYIHTDVSIREGLVFGWRNATPLGPAFSARAPYLPNLLVRIDRQLYQARLLEEGRIALDRPLPRHLREKVGEYRMRV